MHKYLILDRDGTIIKHVPHLIDIELVELQKNAVDGLKIFKEIGFKFGIITNQSVSSVSKLNMQKVLEVNAKVSELFEIESIFFDFIKICPHAASLGCECRKPETLLGEQAIKEFNIDRENSFMVGDKKTDMAFGNRLGIKTIFVGLPSENEVSPTYRVESILQAALIVLESENLGRSEID